MSVPAIQMRLSAPLVGFEPVDVEDANRLLQAWGHYLGPSRRPFTQQGWALEHNGVPVAVAVSASAVSDTVAGFKRTEVVELTRLCSAPTARWATRVMLRLWREIAAPAWPCWTPSAAIAYSLNSRHEGAIYRFDGWKMVTDKAGRTNPESAGWSRARYSKPGAAGHKRLWLWTYGDPA